MKRFTKFLNYLGDLTFVKTYLYLNLVIGFMFCMTIVDIIYEPTTDKVFDGIILMTWILNWYFVFRQWRKAQERAEMWQEHASRLMEYILKRNKPQP